MSGWGSVYNSTTFAMRTHAETLARLQSQASTGLRVLRASDDPSGANRMLQLQSQVMTFNGYGENLQHVTLCLEEASNALQQISNGVRRAQELATQASNGVLSAQNRAVIAAEVNSLLEQVISLANHKSMGRYLFGGASISEAPYVAHRLNGRIVSVSYQGSLHDLPVAVATGIEHSGLVVGEQVFRSAARRSPVFLGNTGAAPGTGTSSVRGDAWLRLEHVQTTYATGTHGLEAGTGSATGDTILGAHTLCVSAGSRQARLDDGAWVSFTGDEANLRLTNTAGDSVYVDMRSWSGENAEIALTGLGRASIDEGASWQDLTDFSGDLVVSDAATGRVLWVDATGITRVGLEPVRVPGTYDLFGALITLRDAMENSRNLDPSLHGQMLQKAIESLEEVTSGIANSMTAIGGRLQAMDTLQNTLDGLKANAEMEKARLGDADLVQVATDLARTQTLYEMTLAAAARLLNLSLLDFI